MSVLIKGMKLPKNGYLAIVPTGEVFISGNGWGFQSYGWSVQPDGQAVELPDHGDLIDRDELIEEAKRLGTVTCHQPFDFPYDCNLVEWCKAAETVIPAERSEDEEQLQGM